MIPAHIVAVGPFGQAVATHLSHLTPGSVITQVGSTGMVFPAHWPLARIHVLAAWRPVPSISQLMDECAYRWRTPWLPIVYEHPYLRVGPLVSPGVSACYTCFRQRLLQHSQTPELTEALLTYYQGNPSAGPEGFLPASASLAAQVAHNLVQQLEQGLDSSGQVIQMNLLNLRTIQSAVVSLHGCPRCGLKRDEQTRSHADLQVDVVRLLGTTR